MPNMNDYSSPIGGDVSTPANDPGMFPTFNLFDQSKPFYQPPDGASKSLAQGFADDLRQAFPFFSGAATKTAPEAKKAPDANVNPEANWEGGNLTLGKTKPDGDAFGPTKTLPGAFGDPALDDQKRLDTGTKAQDNIKLASLKQATSGGNWQAMFTGEMRPTTNTVDADHPMAKMAASAVEKNVNPQALAKIAQIESGNNPRQITGSYKGLFQLSDREMQKYNPGGNILDAGDNSVAATRKMAAEAQRFESKYGRPATVLDSYMVHQQGEAGYAAHLKNPTAPAWQNMLSTGEGQRKGENWAKAAIWGNIPTKYKANFRDVNDVSSQDFINIWANRLGRDSTQPILNGAPKTAPETGKLQLAGNTLDTILKPFGLRQKTPEEVSHEQQQEELARTQQQGEENFAREKEDSGIGAVQRGMLKGQGLDRFGNPVTRLMGA